MPAPLAASLPSCHVGLTVPLAALGARNGAQVGALDEDLTRYGRAEVQTLSLESTSSNLNIEHV